MNFTFAHNNIHFIADPDGYWIEIMPVREDDE